MGLSFKENYQDSSKDFRLSIVTVCRNAKSDLELTLTSIGTQSRKNVECIVVDGGSTDGTIEVLKNASGDVVTKWVSESDSGIYDAMNKGIRLASGQGILFLNAGDYFVGDVVRFIDHAPFVIPVHTVRGGVLKSRLVPKSHKMGLPYCHQGIVFENLGVTYDQKFGLAADYDFYLRHGYGAISKVDEVGGGYVYYDNFGTSQAHFVRRDLEISRVIGFHFGWHYRVRFLVWAGLKWCVKYPLKLVAGLMNFP